MIILRKAAIMLAAFAIMAVSVYFNIDFFIWWGFNQFFAILISVIVVGLMDSIFQAMAWAFREKKSIAWLLLPVWMIFFGSSIFGTYVGMNFKISHAQQKRFDIAQERAQDDPALAAINQQIATAQKAVDGYQADYDKENNWWIKDVKIRPALQAAQVELTLRIEEKKAFFASQKKTTNENELFTTDTGRIDPKLKAMLAILFGFLIDIGSCIVLAFSWIFDKGQPENASALPAAAPASVPQKTMNDHIADYLRARVNGSNVLRGRTSKEVVAASIPPSVYARITTAALDIGLIETDNKVTRLGVGISKDALKNELMEYFKDSPV